MASLQALTVVQVHRRLALTALPLTAAQDNNNTGSISRHTAADHHRVNTAASPRMLPQVTNMISTVNTSTTSTAAHRITVSLSRTRSILRTSLAKEVVMDSNLAVSHHMAGHHTVEHLMAEPSTGNRLMAGQVRNSSLSTSTIDTAEHMNSWVSTRHRTEATEVRAATMEDHRLQHGDRLQREQR